MTSEKRTSDLPPTPLSIVVDRDDVDTTMTVRGEIDLETTGDLSAAFAELTGTPTVKIDLTGVDYMDSTGLRALLVAKEDIERRGGELRIMAASNIVTRLIEITGVDDLFGDGEEDSPAP